MIGFIIYEMVDIAWSFSKISFKGLASAYNWYYSVPSAEDNIGNQLKYLKDEIKMLEQKIDDYEEHSRNAVKEDDNGKSKPIKN